MAFEDEEGNTIPSGVFVNELNHPYDLFDPKPGLRKVQGQDLPDSIRKGQRITTMTSGQARFTIMARDMIMSIQACGPQLA